MHTQRAMNFSFLVFDWNIQKKKWFSHESEVFVKFIMH
jgi:hypothetical protein